MSDEINLISLINVLSNLFSWKWLNTGRWSIKSHSNYEIITYSMIHWAFLALLDLLLRVKSCWGSPFWCNFVMLRQVVLEVVHKHTISVLKRLLYFCKMVQIVNLIFRNCNIHCFWSNSWGAKTDIVFSKITRLIHSSGFYWIVHTCKCRGGGTVGGVRGAFPPPIFLSNNYVSNLAPPF